LIQWLPWDVFEANPAGEPAAPDDPAGSFVKQETSAEVQRILGKLSAKHRMALVLKEYQSLSCDEIAVVMGTSRSAVKSLLFRAREEFRQIAAREGSSLLPDG
jgi:RNA polymerase sigma-70 factor (ECF subfamily)